MIDRLRREVAQLRGQLAQTPRGPAPRRKYDRQSQAHTHTYDAGASVAASASNAHSSNSGFVRTGTVVAAEVDGSWAASSPESSTTNMTHSMTVTSPDSTSSESGASAHHAYPYRTRIAELDLETTGAGAAVFGTRESTAFWPIPCTCVLTRIEKPLDDALVSNCQPGLAPFAGEIPVVHFPAHLPPDISGMAPMQMHGRESPGYTLDEGGSAQAYLPPAEFNAYKSIHTHANDELSHGYAQWGQSTQQPQFHAAAPWQDALSSRFINAFNNADPEAHPHVPVSHHAPLVPGAADSLGHAYSLSPVHFTPSSWRGQGKQDLLETLLGTISSCDEERVTQVVQVVRASATPEDAVSGICRVLGIGTQ